MRGCQGKQGNACCLFRREAEAARAEAAEAGSEAERLSSALREVRGALAQRRADASAASSRGAVTSALLAAKASGALPGIRGRLGALCPRAFCMRGRLCLPAWQASSMQRAP
jgi:hypothetical protein